MYPAFLVLIGLAYVVGSIPFGLIVGLAKGVDPRKAGSGNIGATNVGRLLGGKYFALVFTLDLLKGAAPVAGGCYLIHKYDIDVTTYILWLLVALGGRDGASVFDLPEIHGRQRGGDERGGDPGAFPVLHDSLSVRSGGVGNRFLVEAIHQPGINRWRDRVSNYLFFHCAGDGMGSAGEAVAAADFFGSVGAGDDCL